VAAVAALALFLECGDTSGTSGTERAPAPPGQPIDAPRTPGPAPADPKPTTGGNEGTWLFTAAWLPLDRFVEIHYTTPRGTVGPSEQHGGSWGPHGVPGRRSWRPSMRVYRKFAGTNTCQIAFQPTNGAPEIMVANTRPQSENAGSVRCHVNRAPSN
jgi:hypothetical protein